MFIRLLQGCKVLLVAETKAYFSLYQTISAAGLTAVQLDRSKKLLQTPNAAAAAGSSDQVAGDTNTPAAAAAAWAAAVAAALGSGQCVLITHEHLMHSSMPVNMFDHLVEYVTLDDIPAAAAATKTASSSTRHDEVVTKFSGRHYVLKMVIPELQQAAADIAAAAAAAEQQQPHSVADLPRSWPSTAPATAATAVGLHNTVNPSLPTVTSATAAAAAEAQTTAAAAAVEVAQPQRESAGPQYPFVLDRSSGSLLHQRKALYESLLKLEGQGYVLIERNLSSITSAAAAAAAAGGGGGGSKGVGSSVSAAVDIVLSPVACLIIWGESRLSQVWVNTSQTMIDLLVSGSSILPFVSAAAFLCCKMLAHPRPVCHRHCCSLACHDNRPWTQFTLHFNFYLAFKCS